MTSNGRRSSWLRYSMSTAPRMLPALNVDGSSNQMTATWWQQPGDSNRGRYPRGEERLATTAALDGPPDVLELESFTI